MRSWLSRQDRGGLGASAGDVFRARGWQARRYRVSVARSSQIPRASEAGAALAPHRAAPMPAVLPLEVATSGACALRNVWYFENILAKPPPRMIRSGQRYSS